MSCRTCLNQLAVFGCVKSSIPTSKAVFGTMYGSPFLSLTKISNNFASSKRCLLLFGFSSICHNQLNVLLVTRMPKWGHHTPAAHPKLHVQNRCHPAFQPQHQILSTQGALVIFLWLL